MLQPENIPSELRERRQWVPWKYESHPQTGKQTKVPYNATTGQKASVKDPSTWTDLHTALEAYQRFGYAGIGFVLTEADEYVVIDLDNKPDKPASAEELAVHSDLLRECPSYTETSPSGYGYHIVVRGRLSRPGMRRGNVEVYASGRYMAFTGNVVRNAPIENCQKVLDKLATMMEAVSYGGESFDLKDGDEYYSDAEIIELCESASNGEHYLQLCRIPLADKPTMDKACQAIGYPSGSEADLAIINFLCFWSRNNEQVRRLFRATGLGKRGKHADSNRLIDRCIAVARENQISPVEAAKLDRERAEFVAKLQLQASPAADGGSQESGEMAILAPLPPPPSVETRETFVPASKLHWPPGVLGELAAFFYSSSARPVQELALAAAYALCAGIAGRQYNISRTGLNQYILVVGKTGIGKEGAQSAINNLLKQTEQQMGDAIRKEYIGPGHYSSGQAIIRALDKRPCMLSVIGEFGLVLRGLNDKRGNVSIAAMHKKVLLDVYGKSGATDVLMPSQFSDHEKNTQAVFSPSLTLLGETTPSTFYDTLTLDDIADGLLPRFHIIEYIGKRPYLNENAEIVCPPMLLEQFVRFAEQTLRMRANNQVLSVPMSPEAMKVLSDFNLQCDERIRSAQSTDDNPMAELYNRAHLKALRFAAMAAVVDNPAQPVISEAHARWAVWEVERGTAPLLAKFKSNSVGIGDSPALAKVRKAIRKYLSFTSKKDAGSYARFWKKEEAAKGIIGYAFLQNVLYQQKEIKGHRLGEKGYVDYLLNGLLDAGEIVEYIPANVPVTRGRKRKTFAITEEFPLSEDEI